MKRGSEVVMVVDINEVRNRNRNVNIIEASLNIMKRSCSLNRDKSLFYKLIGRENIEDIRLYQSNIDSDYMYYGNVNEKRAYFNISEEDRYLNFKIFLTNISGLSKYASCGLQKVSGDENLSLYYHILNGRILSEVECTKDDDFLIELNNVVEIRPFKVKKIES